MAPFLGEDGGLGAEFDGGEEGQDLDEEVAGEVAEAILGGVGVCHGEG